MGTFSAKCDVLLMCSALSAESAAGQPPRSWVVVSDTLKNTSAEGTGSLQEEFKIVGKTHLCN